MSCKVPSGNFKKISEEEISLLNNIYKDITKSGSYNGSALQDNAEVGYILSCTMTFPKSIHKILDKFCLGARKMDVTWDMLSDFQKDLWKRLNPTKKYGKRNVYAPSFSKLEDYVVHYSLLKTYAALGIHITIQSGHSFSQDYTLKSHVDFCTHMRGICGSKFEETTYKFIANIVFGKCCESVQKRVDIRYFSSFADFNASCNGKILKDFKIITPNLVQASFQKTKVFFNRPIQIGLTILDYSRKMMLDFWYDKIIPTMGEKNVNLLYSDTDSYYFQILGYSEDKIFEKLGKYIDFSNFGVDHPRYDNSRQFQLGFVKVDTGPKKIDAFLAIRKKSYCYYTNEPSKKKLERQIKLKGIKKSAVTKSVSLRDYTNCLLHGISNTATFKRITKRKHQLYFSEQKKVALNPFDVSAKTRSCGICNTTYNSKNSQKCGDLKCKFAKLFLCVWERVTKNDVQIL
jgi:hypothetical protein